MAISVKLSPKLTKALHAARAAQETTAADSESREGAKDYMHKDEPKEYSSGYIKLLKEFPEYIQDRNIPMKDKLISGVGILLLILTFYWLFGSGSEEAATPPAPSIHIQGDAHFYGRDYDVPEPHADPDDMISDVQETTDDMPSELEQSPVPDLVEEKDDSEADLPSESIPHIPQAQD